MDFIGANIGGAIPVPNLNLAPEVLCKGYPLDFLLQPIIPLLAPPSAEQPSLYLNISCLKEVFMMCKPTMWLVGTTCVATGVVYFAWKLSSKWYTGLYSMTSNHSSSKLDEEVARIFTVIPEDSTLSICSSCECHSPRDDDLIRGSSHTGSSLSSRISRNLMSPISETGAPLIQLQSRIDQVISRVDDVMIGLRSLENLIIHPVHREETRDNRDCKIIEIRSSDTREINGTEENDSKVCITNAMVPSDSHRESLLEAHKRVRELEAQVEKMKLTPQQDTGMRYSSLGTFSSVKKEISPNISSFGDDNSEFLCHLSPRPMSTNISPLSSPHSERLFSTADQNKLPIRNSKRNIRLRNYNFKPFPPIEEELLCCANDLEDSSEQNELTPCKYERVSQGDFRLCVDKDNSSHSHTSNDKEIHAPVYIMKRQGTWPSLDCQQKSISSHRRVSDTHLSSFKHSNNSRFEEINSSDMRTARAFDLNSIKVEISNELASQDSEFKSNNPTRYVLCKKDSADSDDFISDKTDNDEITNRYNRPMPHELESSGIGISKNGLSKKYIEHPAQMPTTDSKLSYSETTTNRVTNESKAQKHKLGHIELDGPARKLSCSENVMMSMQSPSGFSDVKNVKNVGLSNQRCIPGSPSNSSKLSLTLMRSPFRRNTKKNDDFHVKYISKGKSGIEDVSSPNSSNDQREDEWIVIVPSINQTL